jgi:ATP-dependent helicase HrpB
VLLPDTLNRRKIILSTNVAETSVTIDGVRVVIDSGLARRARFDPAIGFTRLELQKVACANLEQRRGRAGRTAPGVCYRLFTAADERQRPAFNAPEIMETDCAPLALEVLEWGTPVTELPWVDAPPKGSWQQAIDLLTQLNAIDAHRQLTPAGQAIRRFNAHPRLANMMLLSPKPLRRLACELAALLSERDLKRHDTDRDADVLHRLDLLHRQDTKASKRVLQIVTQFERLLEREPAANTATDAIHDAGSLLMFAYPDRIAKQQAPNRFLLTQGTSAYFDHVDALAKHEYLVVVEAQGSPQHPRIQLAASVDAGSIKRGFGHHLVEKNEIHIDHISQSVVKRSFKALGAVIFEERISRELSDDEALPVLMTQLKQQGINGFLQEPTVMHFLERCRFVKRALAVEKANEWPNFDEQSLLETLNEWLMPFCNGIRRLDNLRSVDWLSALRYRLTTPLQKQLDAFAPTHLTVPSGSHIRVDYASDPPRIAVRLQEVFGLKDTPRVADGTIALAIELLSPARRPVQLTRDLSSFWKTGYHEVRKELKGRYPKHYWPDDPLQSEPTARAKPRR